VFSSIELVNKEELREQRNESVIVPILQRMVLNIVINGYHHLLHKTIIQYTNSKLNSGNACYHAVQNLSSCVLSENVKIRIYKTIILLWFCMEVKLAL
jgi:hypothetical protein